MENIVAEGLNDTIFYEDYFKGDQMGPYPFGCHLKLFKYLETNKKQSSLIHRTDWSLPEVWGVRGETWLEK